MDQNFDGFISYERRSDVALAKKLQNRLERFGTPWYKRRRRLRVFRDETNMAAGGPLNAGLQEAALNSSFLIVFARPETVQSVWVNREIDWFLSVADDPVATILLVVTGGQLSWNESDGDFSGSSTALPVALRGKFASQPLWLVLDHEGFEGIVAKIAARMLSLPLDRVHGEEIRRQNIQRTSLVLAALTGLLLVVTSGAAVVSTVRARIEAARAETERGRADSEERLARANELASVARGQASISPEAASLFALAALDLSVDPHTLNATMQALSVPRPELLASLASGPFYTFTPDKSHLVVDDGRGGVSVLEVATGQTTVIAPSADVPVLGAGPPLSAVAADGSRIAIVDETDTVAVYDRSGQVVSTLERVPAEVVGLWVSPRGDQVVTASGSAASTATATLSLWAVPEGELVSSIPVNREIIVRVQFLGDGNNMIVTHDLSHDRMLIDGKSGEVVWQVAEEATTPGTPELAATALDGGRTPYRVAGRNPHQSGFLNIETGDFITYDGVLSDDGTLLATIRYNKLIVKAVRSGKEISRIDVGTPIDWVALSPDGARAVIASAGGPSSLWDTATGKNLARFDREFREVAFSSDGSMLAADGRLYDITNLYGILVLQEHALRVTHAAFSPDANLVITTAHDGSTLLHDAVTGDTLGRVPTTGGDPLYAEFSSSGEHLLVGADYGSTVWLSEGGEPIISDDSGNYLARFSPDGSRVATSTSNTIRIWNVADGIMEHELSLPDVYEIKRSSGWDARDLIAFSPDSTRLVVGYADGQAVVWDVRTGEAVLQWLAHPLRTVEEEDYPSVSPTETLHYSPIVHVAYSPDSSLILTASVDHLVRIWNSQTGELVYEFDGYGGMSYTGEAPARFSPDGSHIAVPGVMGVPAALLDSNTGEVVREFRGDESRYLITDVEFSPDSSRLVAASETGVVDVFDVHTGERIFAYIGHTDSITGVEFSPDGQTILTSSSDTTARLTKIPTLWPDILCRRAGRNMSMQEWKTYIGDVPYRRHCAQWPSGVDAPEGADTLPYPTLTGVDASQKSGRIDLPGPAPEPTPS